MFVVFKHIFNWAFMIIIKNISPCVGVFLMIIWINNSTFVQVMTWCHQAKSFIWTNVNQDHWCHVASQGHSELIDHSLYMYVVRGPLLAENWYFAENVSWLTFCLSLCIYYYILIFLEHDKLSLYQSNVLKNKYIDGLVEERCNTIANAL